MGVHDVEQGPVAADRQLERIDLDIGGPHRHRSLEGHQIPTDRAGWVGVGEALVSTIVIKVFGIRSRTTTVSDPVSV